MIQPSDTVENNLKTCNICFFRYKDSSFNHNDIVVLQGIANQCPMEGGTGVYSARVMVNVLEDRLYDYTFSCSSNTPKFGKLESNSLLMKVYPNPNTGSFFLEYETEETGRMVLMDINGRIIREEQIVSGKNTLSIDTKLQPGTYLIRIITDFGESITKRIVITQ